MITSNTPHIAAQDTKTAWAAPITDNERAWIEFIRLASCDSDPAPTLEMVQKVRLLFSTLTLR